MNARQPLVLIFVLLAACWAPLVAVDLDIGDGYLEIELKPDRGRALELRQESEHRWVFRGATAALVGESYSLVLKNRSAERLKVVVGIDGLNVYHREPIVGRSDGDVGSIVGPGERRTLCGWQVNDSLTQRFGARFSAVRSAARNSVPGAILDAGSSSCDSCSDCRSEEAPLRRCDP